MATSWRRIDWGITALISYFITPILAFVGITLAIIYDSLALYWISILGSVVIVLVGATIIDPIADALGFYFAKLIRDNNYRWYTMVVLSVIFSVSAFVAGFGEPLVNKEIIKPGGQLIEETSRPWSEGISMRWNGATPAMAISANQAASGQAKQMSKQKSYHSWYHIKFAIFCWIFTFMYSFFAFFDEAKEAWLETKEKAKGVAFDQSRGMQTVTITLTELTQTPQTTGSKAADSVETFFKRHVGRLLSLEVIGEFLANFIGKAFKKLFNT